MDNIDTAVALGHDLQLVIAEAHDESHWIVSAVDAAGNELAVLATSRQNQVSDAIITAARASAIAQFPARAGWDNLVAGVGEVVKVHAFDRDRSAPVGVYRCKRCDYSPKHAVHDTSTLSPS